MPTPTLAPATAVLGVFPDPQPPLQTWLYGRVASGARLNAFKPLYVLAKKGKLPIQLANSRSSSAPTRAPTKR